MAEKDVRRSKFMDIRTKWLARFMNSYLVLRTFVGVTFFVLAFAFFSFILKIGGDLGRITIVVYGLLLLVLCKILIGEYVLKTVRLQRDNAFRVYSSIVSLNTVFGLIMPLIYINLILAIIIRALSQMTNYGTFWCHVRMSIVGFYYNTEFYSQMNTVIFWLVLMTAALFIFGGLLERLFSRNR